MNATARAMTSTPPFAPPYFTQVSTGNSGDGDSGTQIVETLTDGSTRIVPTSERVATIIPVMSAGAAANDTAGAAKPRSARGAATKDAALVLQVPYADKELAKKAGARWDATRKKWYVPQGSDIQPFKKWWPADMGD